MKKILVTGGAGFIGSHLCRRLLTKGHEVICLDNLYTSDRSNIYDLLGNPRFSFVLWDISQPFSIQVDEIYNLACPNSPFSHVKNPVETIKTVVYGTTNMLELAGKIKAKVLLASSSKVYGTQTNEIMNESYFGCVDNLDNFSCYSESKRLAETIAKDFYKEYGVEAKIARIFTTYGPNMQVNDGKLLTDFIIRAIKNKPLIIYGDGSLSMSFHYIDDLIDGLIKFMTKNDGFMGPINFGTPHTITALELAQKIIEIVPETKSKIQFKDINDKGAPFLVKQMSAKIDLANKQLGREPKIPFEIGLKKTIDYFKAQSY